MLAFLGFLTGLAGPISTVASKLSELGIARAQAQTDQERQRIDALIAEANDRKAVLVAEAWSRINAIMRCGLAFGPFIYLNKVFVWDKVIGSYMGYSITGSSFATDPLDDNLWKVVAAVIAFYFLYDMTARFRR